VGTPAGNPDSVNLGCLDPVTILKFA